MNLGRDSSFTLAAAVVPTAIMLVTAPIYLRVIGPERYGVLALCWTLIAALGFTSLGMGPALAYQLPKMEDSDRSSRSRLVWTALGMAFAASIVGALLVMVIGRAYFERLPEAATIVQEEALQALPLLALMLPLGVLAGVLNGAMQGIKRFGTLSIASMTTSAFGLIAPLAAAFSISVRLNVLMLAVLCANCAGLFIQFVAFARLTKLARPVLGIAEANALLRYGGWMSATALIMPFVFLIDRFLIGALRGAAGVATYVLPYSLAQQMNLIPNSLSSAILPRLAALTSEDKVQELQSWSLAWLNALLTPLAVAAIALDAPFFRFWIGPTMGSGAARVAAILLFGCWVQGISHIPSIVVTARGRPDLLTKLLLAYLVPYVGLLYFATERFGIIGAAAAWTIRAAFDPVLFFFTRPSRADVQALTMSATLVLGAMILALALPWTLLVYWVGMVLLGLAACFQHRAVLTELAGKLWSSNFRPGREGRL